MYKTDINNKILPAYLPDGEVFNAKNQPESNTYKFLNALLQSFVLFERTIDDVLKEMDITTTEDLISRWEKEYGIPDECTPIASTLELRRENLIRRIGMEGIKTIQDFTELVTGYGFSVVIRPGHDFTAYPFDVFGYPLTLGDIKYSKFTLYVDLSTELNEEVYPFSINGYPIILLSELASGLIECVLRQLVPANVELVFRYVL